MAKSLLRHKIERAHGIVLSQTQGVDVGGGEPETYVVSLPRFVKLVACLVDKAPARGHNLERIREHFMSWRYMAKNCNP